MSIQMQQALIWAGYLGAIAAGTGFFTALAQGRGLREAGVAAGLALFTTLGGGTALGVVQDRRAQTAARQGG